MKNKYADYYGTEIDRNGYAPSVVQKNPYHCFLCGSTGGKLDRHEAFGGANRDRSKACGAWVMLCHDKCHLHGVHENRELREKVQQAAQMAVMDAYDMDIDDFRADFGKNYI